MLNRKDILQRTHNGFKIYSAILRKEYPEVDVVMRIVGRDGGNCPNPYDNGNPTLHIWSEKLHPEQKLSDEITRHHDLSGHIADGDVFDFAGQYFGLTGQDLLEHLNEWLNLHIGDDYRQYEKPAVATEKKEPAQPVISYFRKPITNPKPLKEVTLQDVYEYLISSDAKETTEQLRAIQDKKKAREYKGSHFDYCTFSGTFSYRDEAHLTQLSNMLCVDFDHLPNVEEMFQKLLQDKYFETLLLFRSPSGDGLKWVIPIQYQGHTHEEVFKAVSNYIFQAYGFKIDQSGKDIPRPCYLPFDPEAYISPQLK